MLKLTPVYEFNTPIVGGDDFAWGLLLNENWVSVDTILKAQEDYTAQLVLDQTALDVAIATVATDIAANVVADDQNAADLAQAYIDANAAGVAAYPVGSLYVSASDNDPAATLGFGSWLEHASGRLLVTTGSNGTSTVALGQKFGTETVQLTEAQLPPHNHSIETTRRQSRAGSAVISISSTGSTSVSSAYEGDDVPHNNIQRTIAAYVWLRTA